jgi:hypothetical protein
LVYGRIARFFLGLPLEKFHHHWCGNWSGLINSERRQNRPKIAVLMDVDRVMLPIVFDVQAKLEGDTPEIIHPEPLLHPILHLSNQALVSNVKEIMHVQNNRDDDGTLILKHELSSVNTLCHKPNRDHQFLNSAVTNVQRLFQAMKRLSQAEYHLP